MECLKKCLPDSAKKCIHNTTGIKLMATKKRGGVSAEAGGADDGKADTAAAPVRRVEKSARVRENLMAITVGKTLFAGCSNEQMEAVIDAMFEVQAKAAQIIIAQGDMGE